MLTIGERLKIARKAAGLSLRSLAEQVGVSAQAISKYETGLVTPNSAMLLKLAQALDVRVEFFFRVQHVELERPAYRKRTSMPKKQEEAIKAQIQEWFERYLEVEALFSPAEMPQFSLPEGLVRAVSSMEDVERLANDLRAGWELGMAPIENLTALLEDRGIKTYLVAGCDEFDACTFALDGRIPVIATRRGLPGDRQRFNVAHELGHFMTETNGELAQEIDSESVAHRFAGAFLVPAQAARRELGTQRRTLDLRELHILKHKYGLSMQAWIYRARDLEILSDSAARTLFQRFHTMGWHRQEPGDAYPAEEPERLRQLVRRALAEGLVSRSRAAELLGAPLEPFSGDLFQRTGPLSTPPVQEEAKDYAGSLTSLRH